MKKKKLQSQNLSENGIEAAAEAKCSTCGYTFNSRNKLFEHLKTSGHAAYHTKDNGRKSNAEEKKQKGKKGRR